MRDIDDPDPIGAQADGCNYEALTDPERARERASMAEQKRHGGFDEMLKQVGNIDFSAQRNALLIGRTEIHGANRACIRGDGVEVGGIKTASQYAKEAAEKRDREAKAEHAKRMAEDPVYRREHTERKAQEKKDADAAAAAREEEARSQRLEDKKRKLASGSASAPASASKKANKISFNEDDESDVEF